MLSLFAFQLVSSGEKRKANGKERSLIPPCLPGEDQQVLRLVAALLAQDFGSRLPLRSGLLNASIGFYAGSHLSAWGEVCLSYLLLLPQNRRRHAWQIQPRLLSGSHSRHWLQAVQ